MRPGFLLIASDYTPVVRPPLSTQRLLIGPVIVRMADNDSDWSFLRWTLCFPCIHWVKWSPATNWFFYCWHCPHHAHRSCRAHSRHVHRTSCCPLHFFSNHSIQLSHAAARSVRVVFERTTAVCTPSCFDRYQLPSWDACRRRCSQWAQLRRKLTLFLPERNVKIKDITLQHGWSGECGDGSCSFGFI